MVEVKDLKLTKKGFLRVYFTDDSQLMLRAFYNFNSIEGLDSIILYQNNEPSAYYLNSPLSNGPTVQQGFYSTGIMTQSHFADYLMALSQAGRRLHDDYFKGETNGKTKIEKFYGLWELANQASTPISVLKANQAKTITSFKELH